MKITDIKKGDIVIYRNRKINNVNHPEKYWNWYNKDFTNKRLKCFDIVEIKRYKKSLLGYKLKTIYKRKKEN